MMFYGDFLGSGRSLFFDGSNFLIHPVIERNTWIVAEEEGFEYSEGFEENDEGRLLEELVYDERRYENC